MRDRNLILKIQNACAGVLYLQVLLLQSFLRRRDEYLNYDPYDRSRVT